MELDDEDQFELELKSKEKISNDSYKYCFKLPEDDQVFGLHVGGHIIFHGTDINGQPIAKKYTPVSTVNQKGTIDFVIKIYRKCEEFPNGGKFS